MNKSSFKSFLGLLIPVFFIFFIAFVYNYTSHFLLNPYIGSKDLYYLLTPGGVFQLHYPFIIALVILILSFFITLSIHKELRVIGVPIAAVVALGGSILCLLIGMSDSVKSADFVFMDSFGLLSLYFLVPAIIVLPMLQFIFRKIGVDEYRGLLSIAVIALLINIAYIQTCGFGTNGTCLVRKEIKQFNAAVCADPRLKTFEKNDCYVLISSYSGNTSLCSNLVTFDPSSGTTWFMDDCLNKNKYDHRKLYGY